MNRNYLLALLLAAAATVALYSSHTQTVAPYSFAQFKADHGKVYLKEGEE